MGSAIGWCGCWPLSGSQLGGKADLPARDAGRGITVADHFDRLVLHRAIDGIADAHRRLTAQAVATGGTGSAAIESWCASNAGPVKRIREEWPADPRAQGLSPN